MELTNEGSFLAESQDRLVLVYFGTIVVDQHQNKEIFFDGVYRQFSEEFIFHVINVEDFPDLAHSLKVYDSPKIVIYYKGKEIDRIGTPFSPKELLPHVINALAKMVN